METPRLDVLMSSKGKAILALEGYQYRIQRQTKETIRWACTKDKKMKCRGSLMTDLNYKIIRKTDHCCVPNNIEIEVKKAMLRCKKRVRSEVSIPVSKIFHEEFSKFHNNGYERLANIPQYGNVKTALCLHRRKILGKVSKPRRRDRDVQDIPQIEEELPHQEHSFLPLSIDTVYSCSEVLQCSECMKTFKSKKILKEHIKKIHLEKSRTQYTVKKSSSRETTPPATTSTCTTCAHCNRTSTSVSKKTISTQTDLSFHKLTRLTHIFSVDGTEIANPTSTRAEIKQEVVNETGELTEHQKMEAEFHDIQNNPSELNNIMDDSFAVPELSDTLKTAIGL